MSSRVGRTVAVAASACAVWLVSASRITADHPEQFSAWSEPTNLGPIVDSASAEFFAFISKNGLSLYFTSQRPGGFGGHDIWVSQRSSITDPWSPPQNLGPTINTAGNEFGPCLSPDGHVMYFASDRPGGFGGNDIYFSRRHNKRDDFGWQLPDNLGNVVNTAANESSPQIFEDDESGLIALYFDSNRPGGPGPFTDDPPPTGVHNGNDLYASSFQPDEAFGAATLVAELSSPFVDRQPTIRRDGLEIVFASNRPGSLGGTLDLWVSARLSTSDPWSTPANLGPTVNVASAPPFSGADGGPALSFDGTTLYFQSSRPGNFGGALFDLYMSTRMKLK